ncbi:leucine-rich repeat-containing protein 51 isoform X4 [Patagioenas fasciata]|uniref:leucine-rich repeat-containing protein 51 isoform X4 n=1 Tax=Patagioenas fasciata TaxID=372321 RepID=UPI003A9915BE
MPAWEERPELSPPLDFSFCNISTIEDLLQTQPRAGPVPPQPPPLALRLNNNQLGGLEELPPTLWGLRLDPALLHWLDLSFNRLQHIHPELCVVRAATSHLAGLQRCDKTGPRGRGHRPARQEERGGPRTQSTPPGFLVRRGQGDVSPPHASRTEETGAG